MSLSCDKDKKRPLVSILIPMHNAQEYICDTLESSLAQSWKKLEIVVVDDGSEDAGAKLVQDYCRKFPNIRLYRQKHSGAPRARNLAFEKCRGEYIQYLDADDLLSENKIEAQMRLFEKYGNEIVCSSKFSYFKKSPQDAKAVRQRIDRSYDSGLDWLVDAWSGGGFGVVMGWLTHRSLIEKAGPWNETLLKNQDGEFFCRVLLEARKVILSEDTMVYYRRSSEHSVSSVRRRSAAVSTLESLRLYEKHTEGLEHPGLRQALATTFLNFIINYYPAFEELRREAEREIERLGFDRYTLPFPGRLSYLSRIVGYHNVVKLKYLISLYRRG